jgi:uncharacterized membrane protein YeaQ/YmgE (transglycosylase-associated protein family)
MDDKLLRWIFVLVGSTVGSAIPLLWGAGELSFSSILFGGVGAIFGIWLAFKMSNSHY